MAGFVTMPDGVTVCGQDGARAWLRESAGLDEWDAADFIAMLCEDEVEGLRDQLASAMDACDAHERESDGLFCALSDVRELLYELQECKLSAKARAYVDEAVTLVDNYI